MSEIKIQGVTEARRFDSLVSAISAVKRKQSCDWLKSSRLQNKSEWIGRGFANKESVFSAVHERWEQGEQWVHEMRQQIRDANLPPATDHRRRWSEDGGDDICLDRLRAGQQFWRSSHRPRVAGRKVFTIVCQNNALGSVDSRDLLWRGAAAMVLTEMLEQAGYRVELWGATYSRRCWDNSGTCFVGVRLKSPSAPLDSQTVTNAVSGWFFRTLGFSLRYLETPSPDMAGGQTDQIEEHMLDAICPSPRVLIDNCYSLRATVSRMREILSSFGDQ